jgi:hypothetical protein
MQLLCAVVYNALLHPLRHRCLAANLPAHAAPPPTMKFSALLNSALLTVTATAHCTSSASSPTPHTHTNNNPTDTFPALSGTADWSAVRTTANYQNNGPVTDVSSSAVRCYELSPGRGAAATQSVAAGSAVTFKVSPNLFHPGPLLFYMAKVPAGKTAKDWDGSGNVWFKIYEEKSTVANGGLSWASLSRLSLFPPPPFSQPTA